MSKEIEVFVELIPEHYTAEKSVTLHIKKSEVNQVIVSRVHEAVNKVFNGGKSDGL